MMEDFRTLLAAMGTLIIDGALATELEARGHNLDHPLWSGIVLRDRPKAIQEVHLNYYVAGADIAITASYQASPRGLKEHFNMNDDEAANLIKDSVKLAQQARYEAYGQGIERRLLVAGSVGPLGAYLADGSEYRGDYERTGEEFKAFHRPRIAALVDAGADLLAVETMPKFEEIQAILELLSDEFPTAIGWVSCTLKDAKHLSDGTRLEDLLKHLERHANQVVAAGVNCIPSDLAQGALEHMRPLTNLPLVCYPNSGETWDAENHKWLGRESNADIVKQALKWEDAKAKLIGGCCRTGPRYLEVISSALAAGHV
ncbi:AdoMet-homocysteine methyltransferase [Saxophila tyrrhenica]|uniref:AdoMet-homocysteine methyltransferase n=1 Tax=Saxophila tyrrhenica TaxID=1690608 RepID=A0AAV9P877_9PEZI|nr:AdoMet-homocysteine methyltransferase [Saxophila tyrrhenica]